MQGFLLTRNVPIFNAPRHLALQRLSVPLHFRKLAFDLAQETETCNDLPPLFYGQLARERPAQDMNVAEMSFEFEELKPRLNKVNVAV
jgi:hypothetical protein